MPGQPVIDSGPGADLGGKSSLDQSQIDVPFMIECSGEFRRQLQRRTQIVFGDPRCRSLPDEHIAIDAPIAQSLAQALGKPLAAAERSSGNGDDGHAVYH